MEYAIWILAAANTACVIVIGFLLSRVNRLEGWCKALGSQCNSLTTITKGLADTDATIIEAIHGINTVLDIRADIGR